MRQARAAAMVALLSVTGPNCNIRATPANPIKQPSSFWVVSVSSFIQEEERVPKTTAVVLSSAL
jgi:hypothetical protein